MDVQQIAAFALLAAALGYLLLRGVRRRSSGNCCGAKRCPAAAEVVRRLRS